MATMTHGVAERSTEARSLASQSACLVPTAHPAYESRTATWTGPMVVEYQVGPSGARRLV